MSTRTETENVSQTAAAVPQMDLAAQFRAIQDEIRAAVDRVLVSQQFILGREGAALESEIAQLCGVAHGVGVASGTDALILALRACGVKAGDDVLIPPFTLVQFLDSLTSTRPLSILTQTNWGATSRPRRGPSSSYTFMGCLQIWSRFLGSRANTACR
jgi:hypothetical protein